ncbi:MAG: enoyl-CoA hydratase-related protein [Solirubrobacterales bacterium]
MKPDRTISSATRPHELPALFAARLGEGDLEGLVGLYEPCATLVSPDGRPAHGGEAIRRLLAMLLAGEPRITPLAVEQPLMIGEVAVIFSRWEMAMGGAGGPAVQGSTTEVARHQPDGSWLYVLARPAIESIGSAAPAEAAREDRPSFSQLRYEEREAVARITLERPERQNALSMQLSDELTRAIGLVARSQTVKVLVIQGAGGTFCAGDDISEMPAWGNADQIMQRVRLYQTMANSLEELDKLTVAAVDGFAVGGGLEITMACDFVLATSRARWGMPEIDVGITPGWGGTTRMARLVGRRMTKEVNLLGALHPASRAVELGLWNRVVEDEPLEQEVEALVQVLLSKNHQAARQLKFIINRGVEADQYTAQGFEALSAALSGAVNGAWRVADADGGEGILDFARKGELWQQRRSLAKDFWTQTSTPSPLATGDGR